MVTPDEEYDQYIKDPRPLCKYGIACYQRNPLHHEKYKHPPKKRASAEQSASTPPKKRKVEGESEVQSPPVKISNDISDSDESTNESATLEEPKSGQGSENPESDNAVCETPEPEQVTEKPKQRTLANFDKKEFIKEKFLVDMPDDFYMFWEFCTTLNKSNPCNAFTSVGLVLVGPYDVLADKFANVEEKSPDEYLIHWRYYRDPPEMQTVLKGNDSTGYHIGYFRDDPSELPVFVACNHAKKDGEILCMGGNIFAAVSQYLEEAKKSCDPFKKISITKLQASVKAEATKLGLDLAEKTVNIRERDKKILVRTFNRAGLVIPYNKKTQLGYRHLCVSDKELRKLLDRVSDASAQQKDKVMSDLQPVLTATSIATDECDFGTGIELGWDILAHGVDSLNCTIERFLSTAYELLQRSNFTKIIKAHMKNRRKGANLSIV